MACYLNESDASCNLLHATQLVGNMYVPRGKHVKQILSAKTFFMNWMSQIL